MPHPSTSVDSIGQNQGRKEGSLFQGNTYNVDHLCGGCDQRSRWKTGKDVYCGANEERSVEPV